MIAIQTKYLPPTNYRPSRVKASLMERERDGTRRSVVLSWDHALSSEENHHVAAVMLIEQRTTVTLARYDLHSGAGDDGYVFVLTRKPVAVA